MPEDSFIKDYRNRLTYFKDTDAERNDLMNELIDKLIAVTANCQKTLLDLENEQVSRRRFQDEVTTLKDLTRMQSSQPFILVLIDADADDYAFRGNFLDNGEEGGRQAADELKDQVIAYLPTLNIDPNGIKVMSRAYANVKSLEQAYVRNGRMRSGASLTRFVIGFNQRQPLFDVVDVGDWKEGADNKLRECLDFYVGSSQCKHIVFAGCHDSGYASYLGKYAADPSTNDRITLLKGSNIHPRIAQLGFRHTVEFNTVFAVKPTLPVVSSPDAASKTPGRLPSASAAGTDLVNPYPLTDRLGPILFDEAGKRVDKKLKINVKSGYIEVLRKNKLCQWYYLRGECDGTCDKNHVPPPLDASSFDHLWYVSRGGLCNRVRKSKLCDDARCVYGHEPGNPIGSGKV